MKTLLRALFCAALLLQGLPAWSAISCSLSTNPPNVTVIYTHWLLGGSLQGTVTVTCTRNPGDAQQPDLWIGLDQGSNGRTVQRDTGGASIRYELLHGTTTGAGTWTNTGNQAPNSNTDGAVLDTAPNFGSGTSLTRSYNFYVRLPILQFSGAGVYTDALAFSIRLGGSGGTVLGGGSLPVVVSIPDSCYFSAQPSPINVNYTAFSPSPVHGTSNFAVTCTQGTNYTIALDTTRSVVPNVNLVYSLGLSAGTARGTAVAQPYSVNISLDAGQAGRCNASVCTGTDTRTVTVTY